MFTGLGGEKLWLCPTLNNSANDISGNGNNGSYQGGMGTVTDTSNGGSFAYDFDGANDYIRVPKANFDFLVETNSFSQSVWVKSDATGQRCFIGGDLGNSAKNTGLFQDSNGVIRANRSVGSGPYSPDTTSTTAVPISQWTHFAWVVDNTTSTLYMDGVQIFQETGTFTTVTGPLVDDILIGCYSVGPSLYSFLDGLIDDVRIYNRVLTQSEIAHLASSRGVQGGPYYKPLTLKSRVTRLLSNRATTLLERIRSASKPTTPISIKVKHNEEPSYKAGYAKNADESENPHLWKGLVGAWMPSLGVTGDTLRDVSGNGNDGTLTNMDAASDWVATSKGWALDFDGSGEHVNCGDILNEEIDNSLTMTCFCKPAVFGGFQNIFSKPFLYWLHQEQGVNRFRFKVRATSGVQYVQADVPITLGQTYFLTGVMSKNTLEIYVDGKFYASQSFVGSLDRSSIYDLKIGGWIGTNDDFTGSIGNASIYNRALHPDEIQTLYVDSLAPFRRKKSRIGYQPNKELKGLIRT